MSRLKLAAPGMRPWLDAVAVFFVGLVFACCSAAMPGSVVTEAATKPSVEQPSEDSAQQEGESSALDCAALGELGCLDSADCTLRQEQDKTYVCTLAASDCERGFLQRAGQRDECAEGCSFVPAMCYCSPDVVCICGGGPPAICQAAGWDAG